jgi:hypothetical protein
MVNIGAQAFHTLKGKYYDSYFFVQENEASKKDASENKLFAFIRNQKENPQP